MNKLSYTKYNERPWDIPVVLAKVFYPKRIKESLDVLNLLNFETNGEYVYMIDFQKNKFFLGQYSFSDFLDYSHELIEGMSRTEFTKKVLKPEDFTWLKQLAVEVHRIYALYPEHHYKSIRLSYNLMVTEATGKEFIAQHKIIPFLLDDNGNTWLSLARVSFVAAHSTANRKASIINFKTSDQYNFENGKFVLTHIKALNQEDIRILKWMAEDQTALQIADFLFISESTYKRKRRILLKKLGVETPAGAVYKAHIMGLI